MDLKEIKELIELVAEKKLAEFEMEKGGFKLKIRHFDNAAPALTAPPMQRAVATSQPPTPALAPPVEKELPAAEPVADTKPAKELHKIKAPIVGTFYRSPSPTSDVFINVGSRVKPGTVLCIIEAMKLMNEIESDAAGELVKMFITNGQPVEYGQPLFAVRPRK